MPDQGEQSEAAQAQPKSPAKDPNAAEQPGTFKPDSDPNAKQPTEDQPPRNETGASHADDPTSRLLRMNRAQMVRRVIHW